MPEVFETDNQIPIASPLRPDLVFPDIGAIDDGGAQP